MTQRTKIDMLFTPYLHYYQADDGFLHRKVLQNISGIQTMNTTLCMLIFYLSSIYLNWSKRT